MVIRFRNGYIILVLEFIQNNESYIFSIMQNKSEMLGSSLNPIRDNTILMIKFHISVIY